MTKRTPSEIISEPTSEPIAEPIPEETAEPIAEANTAAEENADLVAESVEAEITEGAEETQTGEESVRPLTRKEKRKARRKRRKEKRRLRRKGRDAFTVNGENDIKYRGPLSYRALRIVGWIFFWISQAGFVLTIVAQRDPYAAEHYPLAGPILSLFGGTMTPLFLIASFATMLNGSKRFRNLLLSYGFFSILVIGLFELIYYRYLLGTLGRATASDPDTYEMFLLIILSYTKKGSLGLIFNIFIDLFLCALFVFFLFYRPKKVFVGKKLAVFRLFALVPVCYEIACIVLKFLIGLAYLDLPVAVLPFFTTKPPLAFILFIALVLYVKKKEIKFFKGGKTEEEYKEYMMTNYNSWRFSRFMAKGIGWVVLADIVLMASLSYGLAAALQLPVDEVTQALSHCGIGQSTPLLFAIPYVLLFSYTRTNKTPLMDIVIPIAAILILALMYLEAIYQVADQLPDVIKSYLPH